MFAGIEEISRECIKQVHRLDTITHNISNVNTAGFKEELLYFSNQKSEASARWKGTALENSMLLTNFSQGIINKTGNPLECAIEGGGFFVVQQGEQLAYTRDGRFTLNADNELVTLSGDCVLGKTGPITISGNAVDINSEGIIKADGNEVDSLKIIDFRNPLKLKPFGEGLYQNPDNAAEEVEKEDPRIHGGHIELSNVQMIKEMVNMIDAQRAFESYQKVLQTLYEQDKLSISRIGQIK